MRQDGIMAKKGVPPGIPLKQNKHKAETFSANLIRLTAEKVVS